MHLAERVRLAPYTTMGLGGEARFFGRGDRPEAIRAQLSWARDRGLPVLVLGGGSNLLLPDEGFDGLVLHVALKGLRFAAQGGRVEVWAAAGEDWDGLVKRCVKAGLAGIECLSGIPGSVGATPVQNVGAYGQELADTLVAVEALDRRDLRPVVFAAGACGLAYRHSRFKGRDRDRYLVTGVRLRLRPGGAPTIRYAELSRALDGCDAPTLAAVRQAVLALRRGKAMVLDPNDPDTRSAGSFFVNPVLSPRAFAALQARWDRLGDGTPVPSFPAPDGVKVPAAWLVERAGFHKGYCKGGAAVSRRHALALVNRGATAHQMRRLAADITAGVHRRFGIHLTPEPQIVLPAPAAKTLRTV